MPSNNPNANNGRNYNTPNTTVGGILGNGRGGIVNWLDDAFGGILFGDSNSSSYLLDELSGYNAQQREFSQQEKLLKAEQDFAVKGKYQDMMDIGINPNLAAAGIAGSAGSPSAPSVSNATGAPAAGLSAAAGAVDSVGNIVDKLSSANERNVLLNENRNNLIADTYLKWKEAGWNDIQSKSMALAMRFMPAEKMLSIMNLAASTEKIHAEYSSLMQGIEESKKRISQIDTEIELAKAQRDLTKQQELEVEKRTLGIEIENQQKQWRLDKMKELNIDPNNPIEYNMFIGALEGNQDVVDKGANIIYNSQYFASKGQFSAEAEKAYEIAKDREKGKQESEDEYRQRKQWYEEHRDAMKEFWQWYYKNPSSFREAAMKYIFEELNHINSYDPRKLNYESHH